MYIILDAISEGIRPLGKSRCRIVLHGSERNMVGYGVESTVCYKPIDEILKIKVAEQLLAFQESSENVI